MLEKYAVFIYSHNKPEIETLQTLRKCGYTGKPYIIIDDHDKCIEEYQKKYGNENVLIFSKEEMAKEIDFMDNFDNDKVIIYARHASYKFAKKLGYNYFITFDDDYDSFRLRFPGKSSYSIKEMDYVMDVAMKFYQEHPQLNMIAFAQGADLSAISEGKVLRKCMNSQFCAVDRYVDFVGRMNDDVNAYTRCNQLGGIMLTIPCIQLNQEPTQTTGATTAIYKEMGTYVKSFYTVLQCPSFVKISTFTKGFRMSKFRVHHLIDSGHGYAKIISSKYKLK